VRNVRSFFENRVLKKTFEPTGKSKGRVEETALLGAS
jgi:hypothetical protein